MVDLSLVPWQAVLGVTSSIVGAIGGYEYRKWRESSRKEKNELQAWIDNTILIIGRAKAVSERLKIRSDIDYDSISSRFAEFSEELRAHAETPPKQVEKETIDHITNLSHLYSKISATAEVGNEKSGGELMKELQEMGVAEKGDLDISDAIMAIDTFSQADFAKASAQFINSEETPDGLDDEIFEIGQEILAGGDGSGLSELPLEEFGEIVPDDELEENLSLTMTMLLDITNMISDETLRRLEGVSPD